MRTWLYLLTAILLLCLLAPLPAGAEESVSVLLTEANTGCILYEENADIPTEPGSLSKLMTAYLTAQAVQRSELSPDTVLTAGESVRGMKGAVVWLEPGDRMTVDELLFSLLVGNANDAAAVLADAVSGDAGHFVMDMNAAAFDLGMRNTQFTSPQGFDDPASHTTAHDLGLLACAVLRTPMLTPYVTTWRTFVKDGAAELVNENTLTRTLDGCRGLKAAHSGSRYSLIAAAEQNGLVCAAVVLNCTDKNDRFTRAKALLRDGFSKHKLAAPGYMEEFLMPLRIRGGTEQAVLLELSKLPVLAVPKSAELTSVTVLPEYRQAPVRMGEQVGEVYFYHDKTLLAQSTLCAAEDVPAMSLGAAWEKVRHFLFS
jgi:D-alanyl-D-alanine carboxypeptidase (penicillin-binding protein 5/6)